MYVHVYYIATLKLYSRQWSISVVYLDHRVKEQVSWVHQRRPYVFLCLQLCSAHLGKPEVLLLSVACIYLTCIWFKEKNHCLPRAFQGTRGHWNWWFTCTTDSCSQPCPLKSGAVIPVRGSTQNTYNHHPCHTDRLKFYIKYCVNLNFGSVVIPLTLVHSGSLPVDRMRIKQAFLTLPMAEAFQNLFLDQNIEKG